MQPSARWQGRSAEGRQASSSQRLPSGALHCQRAQAGQLGEQVGLTGQAASAMAARILGFRRISKDFIGITRILLGFH